MKIPWDDWEVNQLRTGVEKYGIGKWALILRDPALFFIPSRSAQQLKDKWRNLVDPVIHSERIIRKFILLDQSHLPIFSLNQTPHIYTNRLPRDAALKAATKDDFYVDNEFQSQIRIKEHKADASVVHVYSIGRRKIESPSIQKFSNNKFVWIPTVTKLATEKYSLPPAV